MRNHEEVLARWSGAPRGLAMATSVVLAASVLFGQQPAEFNPAEIAMAVSEARAQNRELMRDYTWTSRTEVKRKGETLTVKLETVRFTLEGGLQRTVVSEQAPKKKRGVRGKVQKK